MLTIIIIAILTFNKRNFIIRRNVEIFVYLSYHNIFKVDIC